MIRETKSAAAGSLRECRAGDRVVVTKILGHGAFRRRLLEMGFLPGAEVEVVKYAPLRDPIEFILKGYHVSLRRDEAEKVLVAAPEEGS
jgi:Fe2+ transport system protein FeoA